MDFNLNGPTGAYEERYYGKPSPEEIAENNREVFDDILKCEAGKFVDAFRQRIEKVFAGECGKLVFRTTGNNARDVSDKELVEALHETLTEYFNLGEYEFGRGAQ